MSGADLFADLAEVFRGRTVLLTGHTGFKGGWLALTLRALGAEVVGVALPAEPDSFFNAVRLEEVIDHRVADITDAQAFAAAVADVDPDIVVHMAAQALVRPSYADPIGTFRTNVVGTAVVLDAARAMRRLQAIVVVSSDKCYENHEWTWGYRETDPMGGSDPYSASKGCTELVAASFRRSYFDGGRGPFLATARAGNVFGGGDYSPERLVPDIAAAFAASRPVVLRNPHSVRPWQHVLDPLSGYLMLAAALLRDGRRSAKAWNFGPDAGDACDVATLARMFAEASGGGATVIHRADGGPHEAAVLRLDCTLARTELGWQPRIPLDEAVRMTVDWYRAHRAGRVDMRAMSIAQIERAFGALAPAAPAETTAGRAARHREPPRRRAGAAPRTTEAA